MAAFKQVFRALVSYAFVLSVPILWAQSTASNPIVLHHIGPFVGPVASANIESLQGAEVFFDVLNKKGGVNGRPIKLEKIDGKQDEKESARLFSELVDQGKILTLFMPRLTPVIITQMKVAEEKKVPMFAAQTGGIQIAQPPKRYVFTLRGSYQDEMEFVFRQLLQTGFTKFGFLAATNSFGKDVMEAADRVMKEKNIKAVSIEPVDQNNPVVTAAVDAMLKQDLQYIFLIVNTKGAADFVKLYRQKGGTAQFATLSNNGSDAFVKELGNARRGVIVTQAVPTPFRQTSALSREYAAAMQAAKAPLSFNSYYGYIAAKTMTEALRRTGKDLTPEKLTTTLDNFGSYDLGGYTIEFKPGQRLGSRYIEASIISSEGKFRN
jgi:branched-chain amino acid transport system substrate-binding protein